MRLSLIHIFTPCIDFGHLNARTLGGIQSRADYAAILDLSLIHISTAT